MINTLFKRLIGSAPVEAPSNPVQIEGERRLKEIQATLKTVREDYKAGRFSGHPEETLEAIEECENAERVLLRAKKRGWLPDEKVINEVREDIAQQENYMVKQGYSQDEIDSEIAWRQEKLEDAKKGLR